MARLYSDLDQEVTCNSVLCQKYDSIASRSQLSDVLVVLLDVSSFGAGYEQLLLDSDALFLHYYIFGNKLFLYDFQFKQISISIDLQENLLLIRIL